VVETTADGNVVDAVYVIVERYIGGALVQYVERMADRYFYYGYEDSWCVDCALQTAPARTQTTRLSFTAAATIGTSGTLIDIDNAGVFTGGMVGSVVRAGGGIYTITAFTDASHVTATLTRVPNNVNSYTGLALPASGYTIWTPVSSVSGLTQIANLSVTGVADGKVITGTVSGGGTLALGGTYTKVTIGLAYTPQIQTLALDLGEPTVQSKRKKLPAVTFRVADTLGLQVGTSFSNLTTVKDFQLGAIPTQSNGPVTVTDLFSGDGRQILDQLWQEIGQLSIQQNLPYPATILGVMPEVVVGDSQKGGQ